MSEYTCAKCKRPIQPTDAMAARRAESPSVEFYCEACRKSMVDERIAQKMNWVKKGK